MLSVIVFMKALACGFLEDNGRALFLLKKDEKGVERLILPCVGVYAGDPVSQLKEAFFEQTGIDVEVKDTVFEGKWNAGTRKRRNVVPCLVFGVKTKNAKCTPSEKFSGFKWLSVVDAKKEKLDRRLEWVHNLA